MRESLTSRGRACMFLCRMCRRRPSPPRLPPHGSRLSRIIRMGRDRRWRATGTSPAHVRGRH